MKRKPWTIREINYRMPDGSLKREDEFTEEELRAMWRRMQDRAMKAAGFERVVADETA